MLVLRYAIYFSALPKSSRNVVQTSRLVERNLLQLAHRWPPEMCGLRTRPRTDVDPPRFLPSSNCHRRGEGGISSRRPLGAIPCLLLQSQAFDACVKCVFCAGLLRQRRSRRNNCLMTNLFATLLDTECSDVHRNRHQ